MRPGRDAARVRPSSPNTTRRSTMSIARLTRARPQAAAPTGTPTQSETLPSGPAPDQERSRAELFTPAQAGAILRVNAKVLERWRSTGDGPAYLKLSSKTVRYRGE